MNSVNELQVFLSGETIDLVIPNSDPYILKIWSSWFNDPEINKHLDQGIYPNSVQTQKEFVEQLKIKKERFALLIRPKNADYLVGTISLSNINFQHCTASLAHVIGYKDGKADSIFYSLEAKALMTIHAFEKMGLKMIYCEQDLNLINWQRWQSLFGYFIEGIHRKVKINGQNNINGVRTSCVIEDYLYIKKRREGNFWPGKKIIFNLLKKNDSLRTVNELQDWLNEKYTQLKKI
jgi:hypothetical protein